MVVGSIASTFYGEPRLTHDLDLVIDVSPMDVVNFEKLFPGEEYYCSPFEILKDEVIRRGSFNVIHLASGFKIDFVIRKNNPHAAEEFQRKRHVEFTENHKIVLASPEDIIIKKLDFYRMSRSERHISDIRGIIANCEVDRPYLDSWIEKLGLQTEWLKCV